MSEEKKEKKALRSGERRKRKISRVQIAFTFIQALKTSLFLSFFFFLSFIFFNFSFPILFLYFVDLLTFLFQFYISPTNINNNENKILCHFFFKINNLLLTLVLFYFFYLFFNIISKTKFNLKLFSRLV